MIQYVHGPHAWLHGRLLTQVVETFPQRLVVSQPAASLPVSQYDDVTRDVAGPAQDLDGLSHGFRQIGGSRRRRQMVKCSANQLEITSRRLNDRTYLVACIKHSNGIARAQFLKELMSPLDGGRMRRGCSVLPPHAVGPVDHQDHVPARLRNKLRQESAGSPRPRESERQKRDQAHAQQKQQQILQPNSTACVFPQFQELHGAPVDDVVRLLAQQMGQHRQQDAGQSQEHQGIQEIERHRGSPTVRFGTTVALCLVVTMI